MAFEVTFRFIDDMGRSTRRTYHNVGATVADVLTDVGVLAPLLDSAIEGGLSGVVIKTEDATDAFASDVGSNIDTNASVKVTGADGRNYDFDLPMPVAALRLAGGNFNSGSALWTDVATEFNGAGGNNWRINLNNPTAIVATIGGEIDK